MSTIYQHYTVLLTNAVKNNLVLLADKLDKQHCRGMFRTGVNAIGSAPGAPITRWISSGAMPAPFINAITNNVRLFNIGKAAWEADGEVFPWTQAQITTALSNCVIHDGTFTSTIDGVTAARPESPHAMLARLGFQLARGVL